MFRNFNDEDIKRDLLSAFERAGDANFFALDDTSRPLFERHIGVSEFKSDPQMDETIVAEGGPDRPYEGIPPAANDGRHPACTQAAHECIEESHPDLQYRCKDTEKVCNRSVALQRAVQSGSDVLIIFRNGSSVIILPGGDAHAGPKDPQLP